MSTTELSGTTYVLFWVFILLFVVVMFVGFFLVDRRPPRRGRVETRHQPQGDLRDPRGRWDAAPRVDRESDDTRR